MASLLVRCRSCGVHIRAESTRCPFCAARTTPLKSLASISSGAIAFMAGIGCAYGTESPSTCSVFPWETCFDGGGEHHRDAHSRDTATSDQGTDTATDTTLDVDASDGAVTDGAEASSGEPSPDGPADALLSDGSAKDGPSDGVAEASTDVGGP